ncbi:MAG: hypothetical protein ACOH5I_07155 [Oligoflexus sp.]
MRKYYSIIPILFIFINIGCQELSNGFNQSTFTCGDEPQAGFRYIKILAPTGTALTTNNLQAFQVDTSEIQALELSPKNCVAVPHQWPSSALLVAAASAQDQYHYLEADQNQLNATKLPTQSFAKNQFAPAQFPSSSEQAIITNDVYSTGVLTSREDPNTLLEGVYLIGISAGDHVQWQRYLPRMTHNSITRMAEAKTDGQYQVQVKSVNIFQKRSIDSYSFPLQIKTKTPALVANVPLSPDGIIEVNPGQEIVFSSPQNEKLQLFFCQSKQVEACGFDEFDGVLVAPASGKHSYLVRAVDGAGNVSQDYLLSLEVYNEAGIDKIRSLIGSARTDADRYATADALAKINEAYEIFQGFPVDGREYREVYEYLSREVFDIGHRLRFLGSIELEDRTSKILGVFSGYIVIESNTRNPTLHVIDINNRDHHFKFPIGQSIVFLTTTPYIPQLDRIIFQKKDRSMMALDLREMKLTDILSAESCTIYRDDPNAKQFSCFDGKTIGVFDYFGNTIKSINLTKDIQLTNNSFAFDGLRQIIYVFNKEGLHSLDLDEDIPIPQLITEKAHFADSYMIFDSNSKYMVIRAPDNQGKNGFIVVDRISGRKIRNEPTLANPLFVVPATKFHNRGQVLTVASRDSLIAYDKNIEFLNIFGGHDSDIVGLGHDPVTGYFATSTNHGQMVNHYKMNSTPIKWTINRPNRAFYTSFYSNQINKNSIFISHNHGIDEYKEISLIFNESISFEVKFQAFMDTSTRFPSNQKLFIDANGSIYSLKKKKKLLIETLFKSASSDSPAIGICPLNSENSLVVVEQDGSITKVDDLFSTPTTSKIKYELGHTLFRLYCEGDNIFAESRNGRSRVPNTIFRLDQDSLEWIEVLSIKFSAFEGSFFPNKTGYVAASLDNKIYIAQTISSLPLIIDDYKPTRIARQSIYFEKSSQLLAYTRADDIVVRSLDGQVVDTIPLTVDMERVLRSIWLHDGKVFAVSSDRRLFINGNKISDIEFGGSLLQGIKINGNKLIAIYQKKMDLYELRANHYKFIGSSANISPLYCLKECLFLNESHFVFFNSRSMSKTKESWMSSVMTFPVSLDSAVSDLIDDFEEK